MKNNTFIRVYDLKFNLFISFLLLIPLSLMIFLYKDIIFNLDEIFPIQAYIVLIFLIFLFLVIIYANINFINKISIFTTNNFYNNKLLINKILTLNNIKYDIIKNNKNKYIVK
ncbi:MAG: hypothetical protein MUC62_01515, partial [Candidatus Thermoplasmatota archaeon]|nr:hypothetical protein [Candidatus Thermoplasmatota archaeon]